MKLDRSALESRPFRALRTAALALPVAVGLAAPAAAEPVFLLTDTIALSPGVGTSFNVREVFENPGERPRFNDVTFSDMTYLDSLSSGFPGEEARSFYVTVLTNDELNALEPRPDNPFTFTANVTMTNDDGETVSGTATFEVTYVQTSGSEPEAPSGTAPTIKADLTISAPAGATTFIHAGQLFDNPGTNPRITEAEFTTMDYYSGSEVNGVLVVAVQPSEELKNMAPPNPLRVDVTVTMINDDAQTATGTFTLETAY
ncbi:MAG: hypothetical protein OXN81_02685 [Alphaproteobacteria bacterium]|nr:hypothetical protein [Alphaproteobacteria bacterium]